MNRVYLITRLSSVFPERADASQKLCSCLFEDGQLTEVQLDKEGSSLLGNIYVGKVKNILNNIEAAFVEIAGGQICFLPFSEAKTPILTNRPYDGRILVGDELLVQVKRDAVKTKDPVLTAAISVTGTYASVALDGGKGIRYSHQLSDSARKSCKKALQKLQIPETLTLIVRTAAGSLTESVEASGDDTAAELTCMALADEAQDLISRAMQLSGIGRTRTVFSLISEERPAWFQTFQKYGRCQPDKIVTDEVSVYTTIQGYLADEAEKISAENCSLSLYQDEKISLAQVYGLRAKLGESLSKNVWLKSGGYLVIEPTEALTVIDVNSGKYTGRKNADETFALINREAAAETARQLRLRNLSGIILVDFINLKTREQKEELLSQLRRECRQDTVPVRVVDMTALGLVEITRKKVSRPLSEQLKGEA